VNVTLACEPFAGPLAERLAALAMRPGAGEVALYWLGQAGFVIDFADRRILIDPYLSDSLAVKYAGTRWPHQRMTPSPIELEELGRPDLVLCTHRHTDHMDPETLGPLASSWTSLRFVVPAAVAEEARRRCHADDERLVLVDVGTDIEPLAGLRLRAIAAAHESLDTDQAGRHKWLGYVIDVEGVRLYHSGDSIPYPGLVEAVRALAPDVALLPVNGRDEVRRMNGMPGNFTLDEAVSLCRDAEVPVMIAHHHGLFDFNTIAPETIDERAAIETGRGLRLLRARFGTCWRVRS